MKKLILVALFTGGLMQGQDSRTCDGGKMFIVSLKEDVKLPFAKVKFVNYDIFYKDYIIAFYPKGNPNKVAGFTFEYVRDRTLSSGKVSLYKEKTTGYEYFLADMFSIEKQGYNSLLFVPYGDNKTGISMLIEGCYRDVKPRDGKFSKTSSYKPKVKVLSGVQSVYTNSPIYERPDNINSKQIGAAQNNSVTIIEKYNEKYYKVKSGNVVGYLWVGLFKN